MINWCFSTKLLRDSIGDSSPSDDTNITNLVRRAVLYQGAIRDKNTILLILLLKSHSGRSPQEMTQELVVTWYFHQARVN